jgi:hypothetical protein
MKTFKDLKFIKHKGTLYADILFHNNYGITCYQFDKSKNKDSKFYITQHAWNGFDAIVLEKQTFNEISKRTVTNIMKKLQELPSYKGEEKK